MRKIWFRGKQVTWIYGGYYFNPITKTHYIINETGQYEVDPKTVGQYLGIEDKYGKRIYEGDIIIRKVGDYSKTTEWSETNWATEEIPLMEDLRDVATMNRFPHYWLKHESFGYEGEDLVDPNECEIIGNIHDDKKLLKIKK